MWRDFSNDLKYQYVRLLLKDLSSVERYYLSVLRDGVDNVINNSVYWLDDNQKDLESLHDKSDWYDYYKDSELEMIMITLMNKGRDRIYRLIDNFYRSGSQLGYSHMNVKPLWGDSDKYALGNLQGYVGNVVNSINSEVANGVYTVIGDNLNSDVNDLKSKIVELPLSPVNVNVFNDQSEEWESKKGYFSPYTRCLFSSRTEYARAVNTGLLQAYSNYGVSEFDWVTSGLGNVCDFCLELEASNPHSLDEILGYGCPCHVNCGCSVKGRWNSGLSVGSGGDVRVVDLTPK